VGVRLLRQGHDLGRVGAIALRRVADLDLDFVGRDRREVDLDEHVDPAAAGKVVALLHGLGVRPDARVFRTVRHNAATSTPCGGSKTIFQRSVRSPIRSRASSTAKLSCT
jgi:hypothetical protein